MTTVKAMIDLLLNNFTDPNNNLPAPTEQQFNNCAAIFMENPDMWNSAFHVDNNRTLVPNK